MEPLHRSQFFFSQKYAFGLSTVTSLSQFGPSLDEKPFYEATVHLEKKGYHPGRTRLMVACHVIHVRFIENIPLQYHACDIHFVTIREIRQTYTIVKQDLSCFILFFMCVGVIEVKLCLYVGMLQIVYRLQTWRGGSYAHQPKGERSDLYRLSLYKKIHIYLLCSKRKHMPNNL